MADIMNFYYIIDDENNKLYESNELDNVIVKCIDLLDNENYYRLYIIDSESGAVLSV